MVARVRTTQAALAKARARRVALDAARDERDRRVESAAAQVFVLLGERADAQAQIAATEAKVGAALRRVLEEGFNVASAGELVELDPSEIRRLVKLPAPMPASGSMQENAVCRIAEMRSRIY